MSYLHLYSDPNKILDSSQILDWRKKIILKLNQRNFLTQATHVPMQPRSH